MRDCGPTFVVNDKGDVRLVDWDFNAWGGLYDGLYFPWEKDQLVPQKVAQLEGVDRYKAHIVMEGGSFHVDGEGTVITTEECLLSPGRNPDMTREQIEQHLRDYLNVEKVIWLGKGIDPDETNGHVDDVACFVRPGVVLAAITEDKDDWRYELLQDNLRVLQGPRTPRAARSRSTPCPCRRSWRSPRTRPGASTAPRARSRGGPATRPPRPTSTSSSSTAASSCRRSTTPTTTWPREIIAGVFPDREVVTVAGREIVLGGGNVHCITQQQPRG